MSDLFDRLSPTSTQSTDVDMDADELVAAPHVQSYVDDNAAIQHVIVGQGPLTRHTADWEAVQRPGESYASLIVITDYRLLCLVGGCQDPDIQEDYVKQIPLWNINDIEYNTSFMSSEVTVTDSEGVSFSLTPADDSEIQAALEFLRKASTRWLNAYPMFEEITSTADELESAIARGDSDAIDTARRAARAAVSELGNTGYHEDIDVPALDRQIDRAGDEITIAQARGHYRHAHSHIEAGTEQEAPASASNIEDYRTACEAVLEALELLAVADTDPLEALDESDAIPGLPELLQRLSREISEYATAWASDPEEMPHEETKVLFETYRSLLRTAGTVEGIDIPSEDHTELVALARELRATGDTLEQQADQQFENGSEESAEATYTRAISCFESYRTLDQLPGTDELAADGIVDRLEELREKRERSQWRWGNQ